MAAQAARVEVGEGARAELLSLRSFQDPSRVSFRSGGVLRGAGEDQVLRGGHATVTAALARGVDIRLNTPVHKVRSWMGSDVRTPSPNLLRSRETDALGKLNAQRGSCFPVGEGFDLCQ